MIFMQFCRKALEKSALITSTSLAAPFGLVPYLMDGIYYIDQKFLFKSFLLLERSLNSL